MGIVFERSVKPTDIERCSVSVSEAAALVCRVGPKGARWAFCTQQETEKENQSQGHHLLLLPCSVPLQHCEDS